MYWGAGGWENTEINLLPVFRSGRHKAWWLLLLFSNPSKATDPFITSPVTRALCRDPFSQKQSKQLLLLYVLKHSMKSPCPSSPHISLTASSDNCPRGCVGHLFKYKTLENPKGMYSLQTFFFFSFFSFYFLGLHLQHMEIPRLGV